MAARRAPVGLLIIVPVVVGLGVYAFTGQEPVADPSATPEASATATAEVSPTPDVVATIASQDATAIAPAPSPEPIVTERGDFHAGALVRVATGDGDCLNARWAPGTSVESSGVNVCLPEGHVGMLSGAPIEQDGRWWWYMAGAGYVAEEYIVYAAEANLRAVMAPQYAGQPGLIAFQRDDGAIWVMRPDGSEQRVLVDPIVDETGYTVWPTDYNWSPDGSLVSYNVTIYSGSSASAQLRVVDLQGTTVAVFDNVAGKFWSPDSARIAVVSTLAPDGTYAGWQTSVGYADLASGATTTTAATDRPQAWMQDLPSFNHDGSLLLASYGWYVSEQDRGTAVVYMEPEGQRVALFDPEGYDVNQVAWSPVSNQIAMRRSYTGTTDYAVFDVATGEFISVIPVPAVSTGGKGGCGGGTDMGRPSWSRDGARVHFGWMFGEGGTNGIWTLDVATGATSLLPVANSSNAPAGPNSLVVLSDYTHIFIADTAGGFPTLITDGHSPVWSSGQ